MKLTSPPAYLVIQKTHAAEYEALLESVPDVPSEEVRNQRDSCLQCDEGVFFMLIFGTAQHDDAFVFFCRHEEADPVSQAVRQIEQRNKMVLGVNSGRIVLWVDELPVDLAAAQAFWDSHCMRILRSLQG